MPEKIPQKQNFFKKIVSNLTHATVPRKPQVEHPPERNEVEEPKREEEEEPQITEILDSEGHRVHLNRHPRNPWQQ
ncbi:hypothetical protein [uncultured Bdellovibrio sp.]|uniref:hypothetical protein n=1 Tax=Bdellovibrio sp. HCB-162 TaxID=3394234 RepID=UPI0025EFA32B|nr:hypothetical protein [uncultured Bdellovibrio sp.]